MNKELLEKYCNNACSQEELDSVLEWFEGSAGTVEGEALLFKIWEELTYGENNVKMNSDLILDRIHHKINLNRSNKFLEKSHHNLRKNEKRQYFIKAITRIAALLMVPVFCLGLYMSFKYQSLRHSQISIGQVYNVFSSDDTITKISLPDGSNVWLNRYSTLKYPLIFQGDSRTVELTGEGYFEVTHNPKIPFIVKTGEIQVIARGTTFNILSYPGEDRIETSLINGSVELQRLEPDRKVIQLLKMKPNDLAIYNISNKEIFTQYIEDERYYSWKDGKLVFKKEPLSEVVKKLSRWFNVDIKITDPELLDLTYTATFIHETLPQVLELLARITPINYSISNQEEIGERTFTKRKVILSYRTK
jgi:ferric-dicitrate binding protein FerR (iron transport regulator)